MSTSILTKNRAAGPLGDHADVDVDTETLAGNSQRQAVTTLAARYGLWVLVLLGPLSAVANWLLPAAAAPPAASKASTSAATEATAPAGCAAVFLKTYLTAGHGDAALRRYFPTAPEPTTAAPTRAVTGTWPVAARRAGANLWSVTLAADVTVTAAGAAPAGSTRFFQLALATSAASSTSGAACDGFTPITLPAEVGGPTPAAAPPLAYRDSVPTSGPLAGTVRDFLTAYLTGTGELERYTAPGTPLQAVHPAPYRELSIEALLSPPAPTGAHDPQDRTPPDGTRRNVLVTLTAIDAAGSRYPLAYALSTTTRGGRWEITGIDAAPLIATDPSDTARSPR